jgi:hypothetical protein
VTTLVECAAARHWIERARHKLGSLRTALSQQSGGRQLSTLLKLARVLEWICDQYDGLFDVIATTQKHEHHRPSVWTTLTSHGREGDLQTLEPGKYKVDYMIELIDTWQEAIDQLKKVTRWPASLPTCN